MNNNEYRENGKLYLRDIEQCVCVGRDGDLYELVCRIVQRGEKNYLYDWKENCLKDFWGKTKFHLSVMATVAAERALERFEEQLSEIKCSFDYRKVEIIGLKCTAYYRRIDGDSCEYLVEYIDGEKQVIKGLKTDTLREMINELRFIFSLNADEYRLKKVDRLLAVGENIERNAFYKSALEHKDIIMQYQLKLMNGIADENECRWLSQLLDYSILPSLPEQYDHSYVVNFKTINITLLRKSGYTIYHKPNIAMQDYTRHKWLLNPYRKNGLDAAETDREAIDFADFMKLFDEATGK
ncbi:MAG: hypothetical protein K6A14_02840 [Erysipelotrichaceae bacterium]|nr:hypothetical protein [Erysipelotrichaceae bacterium]